MRVYTTLRVHFWGDPNPLTTLYKALSAISALDYNPNQGYAEGLSKLRGITIDGSSYIYEELYCILDLNNALGEARNYLQPQVRIA